MHSNRGDGVLITVSAGVFAPSQGGALPTSPLYAPLHVALGIGMGLAYRMGVHFHQHCYTCTYAHVFPYCIYITGPSS